MRTIAQSVSTEEVLPAVEEGAFVGDRYEANLSFHDVMTAFGIFSLWDFILMSYS